MNSQDSIIGFFVVSNKSALVAFTDSGFRTLWNRFYDNSTRSAEFEKVPIAGDNFAAICIRLGCTLGHVIYLDPKVIALPLVLSRSGARLIYRYMHGSVGHITHRLPQSRDFNLSEAKHFGKEIGGFIYIIDSHR
jgi:hypothetical protein